MRHLRTWPLTVTWLVGCLLTGTFWQAGWVPW